jgi:hypothetical protein
LSRNDYKSFTLAELYEEDMYKLSVEKRYIRV